MKNFEKYKTVEERAEAFSEYARPLAPRNEYEFAVCAFEWLDLDLEAQEEKPLPCPFCGAGVMIVDKNLDLKWRVECPIVDCRYMSGICDSKESAIAAHNRVAKAVMEAK